MRGTGDARGAKLIMITDAGQRAVEREGLILQAVAAALKAAPWKGRDIGRKDLG